MISRILTFMFCTVLALTSVTLAQARHNDQNGLKMVLCTTNGYQTITLDRQGNPVPFTHPCPDCVAAFAAQDLHFPSALNMPQHGLRSLHFVQISRDAAHRIAPTAHARGPPLMI
jgi:hypothetical protein